MNKNKKRKRAGTGAGAKAKHYDDVIKALNTMKG